MRKFGDNPVVQIYASLLGLAVFTYVTGSHGIGVTRYIYVLGCVAVARFALRRGVAYHFEVIIMLFCFSPYLRRIVDYGSGFDARGIMLTGPMLACMVPAVALPRLLLDSRHKVPLLGSFLALIGCICYGSLLSVGNGNYIAAVIGTVKSVAVLLYGLWLMATLRDPVSYLRHAARAFMIVMPITGVYGVMQYFNPSPADTLWMLSVPLNSIGVPEPEKVRVFSTMNAPGSYGMFMAVGLTLVAYLRGRWALLIAAPPAVVGLLLSGDRSAWMVLACVLVYALASRATVRKTAGFAALMTVAAVAVVLLTPFGTLVASRLQSFGDGTRDGSAADRLREWVYIYENAGSLMVGLGNDLSNLDQVVDGDLQERATDGILAWSIESFGMIFGLLLDVVVVWMGARAVLTAGVRAGPEYVVAGSLVFGQLLIAPLSNPTIGEGGVIFWSVLAVAMHTPRQHSGWRLAKPPAALQPASPLQPASALALPAGRSA